MATSRLHEAAQNGGTFHELWLSVAAVESVLGNMSQAKTVYETWVADLAVRSRIPSTDTSHVHLPSTLVSMVEALHVVSSAAWNEMTQNDVDGGEDAARLLRVALDLLPRVINIAGTNS